MLIHWVFVFCFLLSVEIFLIYLLKVIYIRRHFLNLIKITPPLAVIYMLDFLKGVSLVLFECWSVPSLILGIGPIILQWWFSSVIWAESILSLWISLPHFCHRICSLWIQTTLIPLSKVRNFQLSIALTLAIHVHSFHINLIWTPIPLIPLALSHISRTFNFRLFVLNLFLQ